jgi:crotonobetainyl-CoA:carnitine CoA-transferase CaiB-like acyl-CoA transferase
MHDELPLHGLRVLELGHIIAGPSAGLLLADLGADVIKVERPGEGDQSRGMPAGNGANFHFLNRNKRSIAIDLKGSREGRELFLRLVKRTDVVLDNFAYGAVEGLGLGYDVLAKENPGLIYLALKGFLPGPYEARPFLDELAQMAAGLAFMTGPKGQPMRAGASIVDVGAAAYGVIAVLAALQQRVRTGVGQKITSGLYETTVFWVGQWLASFAATGEPSVPMPEIRQGTRMGWGVYQLFEAGDGEQVFIGITSNAHWERFCTEFALKDLLEDERLDTNAKRVAARSWLRRALRTRCDAIRASIWRSGSSARVFLSHRCGVPTSSSTTRICRRASSSWTPRCPAARSRSCRSCRCTATRFRSGSGARRPDSASTRARSFRSTDWRTRKSTRSRRGG